MEVPVNRYLSQMTVPANDTPVVKRQSRSPLKKSNLLFRCSACNIKVISFLLLKCFFLHQSKVSPFQISPFRQDTTGH